MSGVVESLHVPAKVGVRSADTAAPWSVPLSDVTSDPELEAALVETIRSGWWSSGPRVLEFEAAFARMCGSREAIAVTNGTAALHLALLALGCGPGDIEAAITPSTKAIMVMHYGGHPCRMEAILDIASKHRIAVIEDAAHAA